MKVKISTTSLLCLIICTASIARSASSNLIGIAPEDERYYKADSIKCRDGSKKFTKAQLNDDFCDCPDGTDEPGTSACPLGKFYCRNAGHVPLTLYSSRVNDGICDCCDGSDEYAGIIKCPNTCWEAGKVARDRLNKKIATYQQGITLRKQEVEKAKLAVVKDDAELSKLKNEEKILKGLVEQLKERKEQIDKAEEKERLQKEKEEKERKEAEEAISIEGKAPEEADIPEGESMKSAHDDNIGLLEDPPLVQDATENHENSLTEVVQSENSEEGSLNNGVKQVNEEPANDVTEEEGSAVAHEADLGNKEKDESENIDSLSREDLGRIVGSRWTGKKSEQQSGDDGTAKDDDHENPDDQLKDAHDVENNAYDSETEDDSQTYDDDDDDADADAEDQSEDVGVEDNDDSNYPNKYESDEESDLSDITSTSSPSWLAKIQRTVKNILQAVNLFQTPVDKSEAANVRKEYEESSAKLSKIQSRISSLTQKLEQDFGPDKEFYSFYGQCLEIKQNKYVYKICPFKQATQVEGHSTTRLGSWEKFEDSFRIMHFANGDKCWNGPDRSLKVKLRCGLKNEVTDVGEPSRCEYEALLSTPAVCVEEKLKELQHKLELMNKEQPEGHDEL